MPEIQNFDFNTLPVSMRMRFVKALHSPDRDHAPIASVTENYGAILIGLAALIGVSALVVFGRATVGFGQLGSEYMWQENAQSVFYVVGIGLIAYGLLSIWRRVGMRSGLPFEPGRYLFPLAFIEASSARLRMYDLSQASEISGTHKTDGAGRYQSTLFFFRFGKAKRTFQVSSRRIAETIIPELNRRQAAIKQAVAAKDAKLLLQHDPLFEIRTGRVSAGKRTISGDPMAKYVPDFLRWRAVIAVFLGILLGMPLWYLRNVQSDEVAYRAAKASQHETDYQQYLHWGHRHIQEMKAELPRVAFEEAQRSHSVTRLRAVLRRYPTDGLDDEVKDEVHKLYLASLEKFKTQAADADPTLLPFVEQLLTSLEASGSSTLQLRFTRPTSDELTKMDNLLTAFAAKRGKELAPASPWFTPQSDDVREKRIVTSLQQGFSAIFPSDVLQIAAAAQLNPQLPLMDIAYQIGGSGQYYQDLDKTTMQPKGNRVFVGLICKFSASVSLPGQPPGWRFDLSVQPPQTFQVDFKKSSPQDNVAPVDLVYNVMAERAFDELHLKMRDVLFRPGSQAYNSALMGRAH